MDSNSNPNQSPVIGGDSGCDDYRFSRDLDRTYLSNEEDMSISGSSTTGTVEPLEDDQDPNAEERERQNEEHDEFLGYLSHFTVDKSLHITEEQFYAVNG